MNMKNGMRPVHPGEILREEFLIPLEMSANALAKSLRVPAARINEIAREERGVTPDTALRLSVYFRTTPEFWLNLQQTYDLKMAQQNVLPKLLQEIEPMAERSA